MKNEREVPDVFKILGKNIRQVRLLENISQEQLAEKINKSPHLVSLLECGKCGISIPTIIDICKALNVDANSIFTDIIPTNSTNPNNILVKAFDVFGEDDKDIVTHLINYINSKK